uniref:Gustatory receptor n=1 Tax=Plectus sambesii TaxID=2011161 RepID=A0A914XIL8_9BILA
MENTEAGRNCGRPPTRRQQHNYHWESSPMARQRPPADNLWHQVQVTFEDGRRGFLSEFSPTLTLMRWLGLYTGRLPKEKKERYAPLFKLLFASLAVVWIAINTALMVFNVYIVYETASMIGILHVETMTLILTGLKPLQNLINLIVFVLSKAAHERMLIAMRNTDHSFAQHFGVEPRWAQSRSIFLASVFVAAFLPFVARVAQYSLFSFEPFEDWLNDISVLLVPMLSLWQLVPLFYFVYINRLVCFWFRQLDGAIKRDAKLQKHEMDFYYRRFLQLCNCVTLISRFFSPFIFGSLAVCLAMLCLTIYFFVNAEVAITIEPNATQTEVIATIFFPLWAGLQIVTAIAYVICIAIAGMKTNEQARSILAPVLALLPADEAGRFQILCLVQKIQTQFQWGITVWRAFPVERSLLFTLVGMIATYGVVLLKLQQNQEMRKCGNSLNLLPPQPIANDNNL